MPITIKDLSIELGLSPSTVSKALNDRGDVSPRTKESVLRAAQAIGYQPSAAARSLRRQRSDKIGLLVNYPIHKVSDFLAELIPSMATAAEDAEYNLILYTAMAGNAERIKSLCRSREVDGLIVVWPPQRTEMARLSQLMREENMPHIVLPRRLHEQATSFVAANHIQGGRMLTQHLIDLGHRRIGFVRRPEVYETDSDRREGYRRGLAAAGIAYDESLIVVSRSEDADDVERTFGAFLSMPQPPTAIIFFTDPMAIQAMRLAQAKGIRIPQDLSVTGYDGILSSAVAAPALTTVRQPMQAMGALAVETLLSMMVDGSQEPRQFTLPVDLIVRDSTAACPSAATQRGKPGNNGDRSHRARLLQYSQAVDLSE